MADGETEQAGDATAPVAEPEAGQDPVRSDLFGLREAAEMVRGAASLVAQHWLPLLAIAAASLLARELFARFAVIVTAAGSVPGFLALALVPLASLAALVGMLLVVRSREARRSDLWGVIAAAGSVLVPFLVVYESRGDLRADLIDYANGNLQRTIGTDAATGGLPDIASWLVLGIVVVAMLVRTIGGRMVSSERWAVREDARRGVLQVVVGYAEAVWVTLGAWVLAGVIGTLGTWWASRTVAQGLFDAWARVRVSLPSLGAVGDWVTAVLPVLTDAVVTGLIVPVSMLTIAVIVYGVQVVDTVSADEVVGAVTRGRWSTLTDRVGEAPLRQAWHRLSDGGRFGALAGGLTLVMRSALAPVLAYCVLFTLVAQADVVLWWLARLLFGWRPELVWEALYNPIEGIAEIITLVLTVALTALFADRLLTRLGASGQLRRRRQRGSGISTNVASGNSRESTRTETGSASTGTSTSTD